MTLMRLARTLRSAIENFEDSSMDAQKRSACPLCVGTNSPNATPAAVVWFRERCAQMKDALVSDSRPIAAR